VTAAGSPDPTGPEVLAMRQRDAAVELALSLPPGLLYFTGHFPGFAILPGIVQVDWAIRFGRAYLPIGDAVPAEMQIKFRRPIRPAAQLILRLALNDGGGRRQMTFDYESDGVACSSGKFTLCSL
jgi:3-hydroxymyristoyl/3-hydroxydecanoyl-(acyl carrier protein) dehydratase